MATDKDGKRTGDVESQRRIPLLPSIDLTFSPESSRQGVREMMVVRKKLI